ncbi:hypothetical protein Clacol_007294 [Clathrus columnatus]|uniref:NADH:ubiquinone reductase (non-electrogenic) n=1 Tax=Clathrus columnatus TaxID=1419009 RepID=A0AAV5AM87_9AGAM|nr:hypothetical protein Clacol_007294 [Clathrus columnatus]
MHRRISTQLQLSRRVPIDIRSLRPTTFARSLTAPTSGSSSTTTVPSGSTTPSSTSTTSSYNRNGHRSPWRWFLQTLGRVTLVILVTSAGTFYYITQKDRHPGVQLPHDPSKKTLVILGSGWGATSLLKSIDTEAFNVTVISPKNFFLFTPLLPSVAVGTVAGRSIIQPTRFITRHKKRRVAVVEAEAEEIDPFAKTVTFTDTSAVKGEVATKTINYDYLVCAVGAETQTFNIPGIQEHAVFMKELNDAIKFQDRVIDCIETAAFPGQTEEEIRRLLHVVVVGGGPTGVEVSGELHDFLHDDLSNWYPELAPKMRITLIEALPSVLPMFSKELIAYTESTFKQEKINIMTNTMVKEVRDKSVLVRTPDGKDDEVPCGLLVWAGGNKPRKLTTDLMGKLGKEKQNNKRGLVADDHLIVAGAPDNSIYALGDCASTPYAPTAQVASQQGAYLARVFNKLGKRDLLATELDTVKGELEKMKAESGVDFEKDPELKNKVTVAERAVEDMGKVRPFHYSHQGSLAYIGSDKAIADINFWQRKFASAGVMTYVFWRSAYLSTLFSLRNRTLVATDWLKVKLFGR